MRRRGQHGIQAVAGIEITAVEAGRDLHVLGYFFDPRHQGLASLLVRQRAARVARIEAIASRLAELGVPIDVEPMLEQSRRESGRSIGRPQVARAMVEAGHVASTQEAFDRWLGRGLPGFVARDGPTPEAVIEIIHHAGGIASIAHPGQRGLGTRIPALAAAGLDAVEAFHPDHDAALVQEYVDGCASPAAAADRRLGLPRRPGPWVRARLRHAAGRGMGTTARPAAFTFGLNMPSPEVVVSLRDVIKDYKSLRPLRVEHFELREG